MEIGGKSDYVETTVAIGGNDSGNGWCSRKLIRPPSALGGIISFLLRQPCVNVQEERYIEQSFISFRK